MALLAKTLDELHAAIGNDRPAFVPTMGALHEGHLALIRHARDLSPAGTPIVLSIFVNPTQFGPSEDYLRYPRMLEADSELAIAAGATVIFAPETNAIYPSNSQHKTGVASVPKLPPVALQPLLEDAHRPTHFAGVCQVVARLFDLVQPAIAVFGEKDYQQFLVIRAMAAQEHGRWNDLRIIAHPTIREADGLAMSSRNRYLKPAERQQALGLWRALNEAAKQATPRQAEHVMNEILSEHGFAIDYAVVRDATTLLPIETYENPARGLIAARLQSVRLIDNLPMKHTG